jgi:hypothetical protein
VQLLKFLIAKATPSEVDAADLADRHVRHG